MPKFQSTLTAILSGRPDTSECKGLARSLGTAFRVLDPGHPYHPDNPIDGALFFASGGAQPAVNTALYELELVKKIEDFEFFRLVEKPPIVINLRRAIDDLREPIDAPGPTGRRR